MRTHVRERIYIDASLTPSAPEDFKSMRLEAGDLPTGVLVGTVEVVDCSGEPGDYRWHLKRPKRLRKRVRPEKHPQPSWFKPF